MKYLVRAKLVDTIEYQGKTYVPDFRIAQILQTGAMSFKTVSNLLKRDKTPALHVKIDGKHWFYTLQDFQRTTQI